MAEKKPPISHQDYVPPPKRYGGSMGSIAAALPKVMKSHARKQGFVEAELVTHWKKICPKYAEHTRPLGMRQGILTVAVASASAAQQLQYWLPTLQARVNTFYGYEVVTRVRLAQRAFSPLPERELPPVIQRPAEHDKSRKACAKVADVGLQSALAKLGNWVFNDAQQSSKSAKKEDVS